MILRDRDRVVDPCCDNVVGTGFRWPSAIIFILCFVYFDHNGGSASTRCPRWPRSSTRTVSLHGFTKCDCVNKFFFLKQNVLLFFHEAWNAYFIFRELWKDRFIFREMWSRPPLFHPLHFAYFRLYSYKLFASYIINVWSCAEILPDSDS